MASYIEKALATERFVGVLEAFVQRIAPYGYRNSLCQVALKLTCPGVPDIYQGCEVWNFSLVDPDNRRPVDFAKLAASLEPLRALYEGEHRFPSTGTWADLLGTVPAMAPAAKQLVVWRLLQLRRQMPALFRNSIYLPLAVEGLQESHALAFARMTEDQAIVVVCGRLLAGLESGQWDGTVVTLADAHPALARPRRWLNWMTGELLENQSPTQSLDTVLGDIRPGSARLPFAVLVAETALT